MNALALFLTAAKLFVPQGSDEQINHNPLSLGEAAFVQESENEASVFVGSDGTTPLGVIDRSALRGYRLVEVPRKNFVVIGASPLVRNVQNDTWTWSNFGSNNVATLTFSVPERYRFTDASVTATADAGPTSPHIDAYVTYVRSGSTVTATVRIPPNERMTVNLTISEPRVMLLECGDVNHVTNLDEHRFFVKDSIGESELGQWRTWARDLYNGNRGQNWSAYPAYKNVKLENNSLVFDKRAYFVQKIDSQTNLVTHAGGLPAVEIGFHGTAIVGALSITGCAVTNGAFYITYEHDIVGFDPSQLDVMETYGITQPIAWTTVPSAQVTRMGSDRIIVAAQTGVNQRFLKLHYIDGSESAIVDVKIHGIVSVDDLNVGGTNILALIKSGGTGGGISEQRAKEIVELSSVTNGGAKSYADATFLEKSGGSMTGPISMDYNYVNLYINGAGFIWTGTNEHTIVIGSNPNLQDCIIFGVRESYSEDAPYSMLRPDFSDVATSNMVERISTNVVNNALSGRTYDFANGSNFTLRVYTALTNVVQTLGGTVANPPTFTP